MQRSADTPSPPSPAVERALQTVTSHLLWKSGIVSNHSQWCSHNNESFPSQERVSLVILSKPWERIVALWIILLSNHTTYRNCYTTVRSSQGNPECGNHLTNKQMNDYSFHTYIFIYTYILGKQSTKGLHHFECEWCRPSSLLNAC